MDANRSVQKNNSRIKEYTNSSKCTKIDKNVEQSDIKNASVSLSSSTSSIGGVNNVLSEKSCTSFSCPPPQNNTSIVPTIGNNQNNSSGNDGDGGGSGNNDAGGIVADGTNDEPETLKSINEKNKNVECQEVKTNSDDNVNNSDLTNNLNNNVAASNDQSENITNLSATTTSDANNQQTVSYNDFVNLMNDSDTIVNSSMNNSGATKDDDAGAIGGQTTSTQPDDHHDDDIKPLLFEHKNEKRKPRGIVKSPSYKSFEDRTVDQNNYGTNGTSIGDAERPVLHVQFQQNGGIPSMYGGRDCSSPASSVSSTSSSSSDDEESSFGQYSEAQPPDGGWGWVVVFASFIVNLIADGITFSFGVIYVEFLNYFGEGKGKTAWIGSLFMAMPLLSGPVASFLTDRYGCRKVTIAGSILACIGFVISSFSTSMEMLFLTFGIIAGFGLSLCYVAAVVIVAYYFDKRRSFATGLSVCGSGIGTFIFAPLTQVLIENYGWRGTTLILAGFFLNMTVCGMLMRDLEWTTHRAKLKAKQRKQNKLGISAESFSVSNSTNTGGTGSNLHQQPFNIGENDLATGRGDATGNPRLFSSLITLPTFMRNGEKVILSIISQN